MDPQAVSHEALSCGLSPTVGRSSGRAASRITRAYRPAYDPEMEAAGVAAARKALLEERSRLRDELAIAIEAPGQMTYGSQAAAATHVFEQQRDLALRGRSENQLALVEAALARIDDGRFGACVRCGQPVAPERLEALPWAEHCIDCARLRSGSRG